FSRLAQRSLALRPAHSRGHQFVTAIRRLQPFRYLHDCSDRFRLERIAGWALHPLESAALSRRTPFADIRTRFLHRLTGFLSAGRATSTALWPRAEVRTGLALIVGLGAFSWFPT